MPYGVKLCGTVSNAILLAAVNVLSYLQVLIPGGRAVGVSRRITGPERKRLRQLAQELLPTNFSLTVRTEALGHDREELEKDLARLLEIWKEVLESASAAAVAAEHGLEGAVPVLLQTLSLVRDFFNNKVREKNC